MERDILVDAGPLVALFDRDDAFRERALAFVSSSRHRFVTTTPVMTEVLHMIDFDVYRLPGKERIRNVFFE